MEGRSWGGQNESGGHRLLPRDEQRLDKQNSAVEFNGRISSVSIRSNWMVLNESTRRSFTQYTTEVMRSFTIRLKRL